MCVDMCGKKYNTVPFFFGKMTDVFPFVFSFVFVYLCMHIRVVFQELLSLYVLLSVRECSTQHAHQEKRLVTG